MANPNTTKRNQKETGQEQTMSESEAVGTKDTGTAPAMQNRMDRSSEGREARKRERAWRRSTILPAPNENNEYDYRYVRVLAGKESDEQNYASAQRDGWEAVKATDVPELQIPGSQGKYKGSVLVNGMLLCRRPKFIGEEIAEDAAEESINQVRAIDENWLSANNKNMRKFSERKSTVSRKG